MVESYIKDSIGPRAILRDLRRTLTVLSHYGPRLPGIVESALMRQSNPTEQHVKPTHLKSLLWAGCGAVAGALAVYGYVIFA